MRCIGFYSFKGGVGRSNLVMNIAYHLAQSGRHVGILDLDLEAPGLTMAPSFAPAQGVSYPDTGLDDYFKKATESQTNKGKKNSEVPDIVEIFYQTGILHDWSGSVFLAPASVKPILDTGFAEDKEKTAKTYDAFLQEFGKVRLGEAIFMYMKDRIAKSEFPLIKPDKPETTVKLDYLLVDLRTGLSELADTAIGVLVSELMIVSGLNTQNIEGLFIVLNAIDRLLSEQADKKTTKRKEPLRITPVFSPIPNAELDRVNKRLTGIYDRLLKLSHKKNWLTGEGICQLMLPSFSSDKALPDLPIIHYCDYLGVEDGIILEKYPSTLAAKEILSIARRFTKSPEDYANEIQTELKEKGIIDSLKEIDNKAEAWSWVFEYMRVPPSWKWPLELFGEKDFDKESFQITMTQDLINKDPISKVGADDFINHIGASISLSKDEKIRVLQSLKKLSESQLNEVMRILQEEKKNFQGIPHQEVAHLGSLIISHLSIWQEVLKEMGAKLLPLNEKLRLISEKQIGLGPVPIWALLLAYTGKEEDIEIRIPAIQELLRLKDTPVSIIPDIFQEISDEMSSAISPDVAEWFQMVKDMDLSANVLFDIAYNLQNKFKLYEEAEIAYKKALEIKPDYHEVWNNLGNLLADQLERYEEAEESYKKALEIKPDKHEAWYNLGLLFQNQLERYEEAEESYRKALEIKPDKHEAWNNLGNLLQNQLERYEEAEECYGKAIEIKPDDHQAWNNLGGLLQNQFERYEEAEKSYRKALKTKPDDHQAWNNLGTLLTDHLKRYAEAKEAYEKSIETADADLGAAYGYYNLLRLIRVFINNKEEYGKILKQADKWIKENIRASESDSLELVHAALFALCAQKDILENLMPKLGKKAKTTEELLWAKIIGCTLEKQSFEFEPYQVKQLPARDLEGIVRLSAILADLIKSDKLNAIKSWLKDAITNFVPPPKTREIHWTAIEGYLEHLGIEISGLIPPVDELDGDA
jgi:tetratricopeptide (TPR) repeat protein